MGSGYHDFTAGEIPTADVFDGYLMRQTVMTFASAAARDSALSGVLDEGMPAYLKDVDSLSFYLGAAWATIGPLGAWTSYTPTFTGSSSNPVLGSGGAISGEYTRLGRMVTFRIGVSLGTGGGGGSGVYRFSLPAASAGSWYGASVGTANCNRGGTQRYRFTEMGADGTYVQLRDQDDSAVTNTVPFTWTTGDLFRITGTYQAAS